MERRRRLTATFDFDQMSKYKDIPLFFNRVAMVLARARAFTYECYETNVNMKCNEEDTSPSDVVSEIRSVE